MIRVLLTLKSDYLSDLATLGMLIVRRYPLAQFKCMDNQQLSLCVNHIHWNNEDELFFTGLVADDFLEVWSVE